VDTASGLCSAEGKSKQTAFLLSFLAGGLGADWFYLSRGEPLYLAAGAAKLLYILLPTAYLVFSRLLSMAGPRQPPAVVQVTLPVSIILLYAASLLWWLLDWVRIITDFWAADGAGVWLYLDL
jgi:hypothetical protein